MENKDDEVKKAQVVEARARNISHNVRCTECGSQSIEDSQADIAILLRKLIPLWLSPLLVAGAAAGVWAYKKHRQKTNVHIMALDLVRGVPLTPKEKETMLDLLTPPPQGVTPSSLWSRLRGGYSSHRFVKGKKVIVSFLLGFSGRREESPQSCSSSPLFQMLGSDQMDSVAADPQKRMQEAMEKGIATMKKRMASVELENLTAQGLLIDRAHKGSVHCTLTIPPSLSDAHGNWQSGAIATLIDMIASVAIYTETGTGRGQVTMDYSISYYSSAKIQEKVEIEAKVIGNKGKLTSVVVEVRKEDGGALIAVGKMWAASNEFRAPWTQPSKL
ncbi:hypothetical protein GQ457_07G031750 [Hibiscus cannabinus]